MNPSEKLELLRKQEEILKSYIKNLESQKQRLEIEENELTNCLNKEENRIVTQLTSNTAKSIGNESKNMTKDIDLSLNLLAKSSSKINDEEEDEDDE